MSNLIQVVGAIAENSNNGALKTLSVTRTDVQKGDVCVIYTAQPQSTKQVVTVSDSLKNSYLQIGADVDIVPPDDTSIASYYAVSRLTSLSTVFSVDLPANSAVLGIAVQILRNASAVPLGVAAFAGQAQIAPGSAANAVTSGLATPGTADPNTIAWLVLGLSINATGSAAGRPNAGTGFTDDGSIWQFGFGPPNSSRAEDKRVTSSANVAATFTITGGTDDYISLVSIWNEAVNGIAIPASDYNYLTP